MLAAVLNGVGRQKEVAAVSLLGGGVQLACTLVLIPLPGLGMKGYVAGALVSTALELVLCLSLVLRHTGLRPQLFRWMTAPGLASLLAALNTNLLLRYLKASGLPPLWAGLAVLPSLWSSTCPLFMPRESACGIHCGSSGKRKKDCRKKRQSF